MSSFSLVNSLSHMSLDGIDSQSTCLDFNVLSRKTKDVKSFLATRLKSQGDLVRLERFCVVSGEAHPSFSLEKEHFHLGEGARVRLMRDTPKFCRVLVSELNEQWDLIFASTNDVRTFAANASNWKCRVSLDGEFFAPDEKAVGFEVKVEHDENCTLLWMVNNASFFVVSKSQHTKLINANWTRSSFCSKTLVARSDNEKPLEVEFRTYSSRERFLGQVSPCRKRRAISVFSGTWNVGNSSPPTARELARGWLDLASFDPMDLYAFALQECSKKDEWSKALGAAVAMKLNGEEEPYRLAFVSMREVQLIVFASPRFAKECRVLGHDVKATGIANQIGNKGAVGVGLHLGEFGSLAFVSAHLAAFQGNIKRRAQDHRAILQCLNIDGGNEMDSLERFDRVVFLGDLNYRVELGSSGTPEEYAAVEALALSGRWAELAKRDQLIDEMKSNKVFYSFQEAKPVSFPPTYRMMKNTGGYSNKRDQNPSFTDRILIRGNMKTLTYGANHELAVGPDRVLTCSDHRCVYAMFAWEEDVTIWPLERFVGAAEEKDIWLKFDDIVYSSSAGNNSNTATDDFENIGGSSNKADAADFVAKTPILNSSSKIKKAPSTRRLFTSRLVNTPDEDDSVLSALDDDVANSALDADAMEHRIVTAWSTSFPLPSAIKGSSGRVRLFYHGKTEVDVRVEVYTRYADVTKTVGFARFKIPSLTLPFAQIETGVECRGTRVGSWSAKLTMEIL